MSINKYTIPKAINGGKSLTIKDGKVVITTTKGKPMGNGWVVSCSINGKQYKQRISSKIDAETQATKAEALIETWYEMLTQGLNPFIEEDKKKMLQMDIVPTLLIKIDEYEEHLKTTTISYDTRQKTIKRLKILAGDFVIGGKPFSIGNKKLEEITTADIEKIYNQLLINNTYADSTFKIFKSMISSFFNHYMKKREIDTNPTEFISKQIKSTKDIEDVNEPFEDDDFVKIMDRIKEFPKLYLFTQFLYHTCARPTEVRKLKVGAIKGDYIIFKASESKTGKKDEVFINSQLRQVINSMNLHEADKDDYLFSNLVQIEDGGVCYGKDLLYRNYASNFFREEILKPIGMYDNKGYNLYSFKATSNCHKLLDKWSLIEIQRLNRHSSITATEKYIKKIKKYIKLEENTVRVI